jgi:hypothetical protein
VKKAFPKLPEKTWKYLFWAEMRNGLHGCRVHGRGRKKAYYSTIRLIEWLVNEGYYTQTEFERNEVAGRWTSLVTRTHTLALQ